MVAASAVVAVPCCGQVPVVVLAYDAAGQIVANVGTAGPGATPGSANCAIGSSMPTSPDPVGAAVANRVVVVWGLTPGFCQWS